MKRPGRPSTEIIAISANTSWNLVNFRSRLIQALIEQGRRVVAIAPEDQHTPALLELGAEFEPITISSSGTSPVQDARLLLTYRQVLRRLRPHAFLGVTIKPNIYGSLAAQSVGAQIINNISGLGSVFIERSLLTGVASTLYRLALRRSGTVFFQNRTDLQLFVDRRIVRPDQAVLLPGSGIDLQRFVPAEPGSATEGFRFLFAGRLQRPKGLVEFVDAARIVRRKHRSARFQILGAAGLNEMMAVPIADVERWHMEGLIEYLGETDDVRPFIANADCVVLPSYREGLPRVLLEGSALGKPLIATDVPGCRDVVEHGHNGMLCEVRSAESLANAMTAMIELPATQRQAMGRRARHKVEQEFCETLVVEKYLIALGLHQQRP